MKHEVTIWLSLSKSRGHNVDRGEQVVVELLMPLSRKHPQLCFTRKFFNFPDWEESSQCTFSVNDAVLKKLIKILEEARLWLRQ